MKRAALVFVTRADGGVLSVWNRKYHVWDLPGGKVEDKETLAEAAVRGCYEKTGRLVHLVLPEPYVAMTAGHECHTFRAEIRASLGLPTDWATTEELGGGVGWMPREFLARDIDVFGGARRIEASAALWFRRFFRETGW